MNDSEIGWSPGRRSQVRQEIALALCAGLLLVVVGCAGTPEVADTSPSSTGHASYLAQGNEYADKGMFTEAEASYTSAIRTNSRDSRAYVNLAQVYAQTDRLEEAEQLLNAAIKLNPREFRAHNLLGNVCYERKSYNAARYHYRNALAIEPTYYEAHWNLVATCFMLNKNEEALEHCREYVELAPESEAVNLRRARVYLSGQRLE